MALGGNKTICDVHNKIEDLATQKFYRRKPETQEEWEDLLDDMERAFSEIEDLVGEGLKMGQRMEDGLRNRKEYMIEKGIEDEYQA